MPLARMTKANSIFSSVSALLLYCGSHHFFGADTVGFENSAAWSKLNSSPMSATMLHPKWAGTLVKLRHL
jgi:hypothetical protein